MSANTSHHHEPTPLKTYLGVYGLLLFLTIVTVGISYLGLPPTLSIVVAMSVALVKAFFVAAWFMHLAHDSKFNVLFFLSAFWFIAAFFIFTMGDLSSRDLIMKSSGSFELREDKAEDFRYQNPELIKQPEKKESDH
jgi:cytochrome c oxidase subunit 4